MAHSRNEFCGCFPTGQSYPGIADLLLRAPTSTIGLAAEFDAHRPFHELPLAVIDTETTGKDPARGDRVVEIAIVHFDNGQPTERHAVLVDPGIPIPPEASAVHGIKDEDVRGKPRWDAVAKQVAALMGGRIPVAYNASFDRTFIYSEMRRAGVTPGTDRALAPALRTTVEWIDPLVWARAIQPTEKGFKLGDVAARLGVALVGAHRATNDAEAAGFVLAHLLRDQKLTYREVVHKQREHQAAFEKARGFWRR